MNEEFVTVYLELEYVRTDPIQYKPYSPSLKPTTNLPIYLAIDIKESFVDSLDPQYTELKPTDGIVITTEGLADLMGQIAMAIKLRLEGGN
jgi:hypothetical protein